ncbi:DUF1571 domain-containing protein [Planctomicrobium sp. SH527]|uniref:DUF1571 domain-containing protein n=1 Tax=Planctomicrobium sp. SH527 TaxID=3448123 RepID=UPI003F5C8A00
MGIETQNRRHFLATTLAGAASFGMGWFSRPAFAGPTQILEKVDAAAEASTLGPAFRTVAASMRSLDDVQDYTATFYKKELVGRKMIESRMGLKLREAPFSVYLKFVSPSAGREVLYVHGQDKNQLKVKEVGFAGLAGTVSLDPTGSFAMDENRYPVTSIGLRHLTTKLLELWLEEAHLDGQQVRNERGVSIGTLKCNMVEVTHTKRHQNARFQTTRLFMDEATGRPIRFQALAFAGPRDTGPQVVEDYLYGNLQFNVGLNEMDFSTRNPQYNF